MHYGRVVTARFVSRPNRFVAVTELNGEIVHVHVKNTGRCRELLVEGNRVVLADSDNPDRKYRYDLIAVYKGDLLVNMDSQAPNKVFAEWAEISGYFGTEAEIRPEVTIGDSRFDFLIRSGDRRIIVEVKGVTLENDGVCMFPDAPTQRGTKHVNGLRRALSEGYETFIALVVQMDGMRLFRPNRATDPVFSDALEEAQEAGVGILCLECEVKEDSMEIVRSIPFDLTRGSRPAS